MMMALSFYFSFSQEDLKETWSRWALGILFLFPTGRGVFLKYIKKKHVSASFHITVMYYTCWSITKKIPLKHPEVDKRLKMSKCYFQLIFWMKSCCDILPQEVSHYGVRLFCLSLSAPDVQPHPHNLTTQDFPAWFLSSVTESSPICRALLGTFYSHNPWYPISELRLCSSWLIPIQHRVSPLVFRVPAFSLVDTYLNPY